MFMKEFHSIISGTSTFFSWRGWKTALHADISSRSTVRAISTLISCWLYLNQQSKWSYCSVQIWNDLMITRSVGSWFNKTCCLNIGHLCLLRITKESVTGQINEIRSRCILLWLPFIGSTVLSCHIFSSTIQVESHLFI